MGAKEGRAFHHGRSGGYGKRRNFVNRKQASIQVSYIICTCLNFMPFYYRAVGGVDKKTFSVELEFFDDVIPQVKMTIKCF